MKSHMKQPTNKPYLAHFDHFDFAQQIVLITITIRNNNNNIITIRNNIITIRNNNNL